MTPPPPVKSKPNCWRTISSLPRHVKVETTDGVVQLSGIVDSQAQSDRAESIAKAVDGVKSVKNDLKTK